MAQDFGDDMGDLLLKTIGRVAERAIYYWIDKKSKDWHQKRLEQEGVTPEEAAIKADALASREQICIPFGTSEDAAYMAQVCRENGTYAAALTDSEGRGFLQFAKDDTAQVQGCARQFSEVMTSIKNKEISDLLAESAPVTEDVYKGLIPVEQLPDLPSKEAADEQEHGGHVPDDRANDAYIHSKGIADKVKAAREQCRDYDDFKEILSKEGIGITDAKNGELMYYEARPDGKGGVLPFGKDENGLMDWAVRADTLKRNWHVDATRDWFTANTPKEPSIPQKKDLQLICNAVRADLEQSGIRTLDRADGQMGFLVHCDHKLAVVKAVENRFPGHAPDELGIQFYESRERPAPERIPAEPQVADGSMDMDGSTPDINQNIESHDGMDTATNTFRMEYEATASGDVAPSEMREQAATRDHDDGRGYCLESEYKSNYAASKQLERESGVAERDIDISDKLNPVR